MTPVLITFQSMNNMKNIKSILIASFLLLIHYSFVAGNEIIVYSCGFEDNEDLSGWNMSTSDAIFDQFGLTGYVDMLHIGDAEYYTGNKSLYASQDNGNSSSIYLGEFGSRIRTAAELQLSLPAGEYIMSFNYKCVVPQQLSLSFLGEWMNASTLRYSKSFDVTTSNEWEFVSFPFSLDEEINWLFWEYLSETYINFIGITVDGFAIDNIIIRKKDNSIPTIAEMEEQGLVHLVSDLEYADMGTWGDDKSISIQTSANLWFGSYVCKYNLNAEDFLSIMTTNPVVLIYKGEVQQPLEYSAGSGVNQFLFKAEEAGMYYLQITDTPNSGEAMYAFNIRRYGQLQSLSFGNTSHIVSDLTENEIINALNQLTVTGTDRYGQSIVFLNLLPNQWFVSLEESKATFVPVFPPFMDFEFPLISGIDNIVSWFSATDIIQTSVLQTEITAHSLQITVSNTAEKVSVYSVFGQLVTSGEGAGNYAVPQAGVYVVKVGDMVKKVIVR